ncbi:MAG: hypothetical protein OXU45_06990 [Candidatus Melainabacteria bacterium]|nr:hypothetical protein [Candidatus Melainabacteria bacterium]
MPEAELLEFIESSHNFSVNQILDYLDYIYEQAPPIDIGESIYDCCGTGGDAANTFNISTTTAIVAAAAGIKVCKNGGRSSSSTTGSVDVLEALGLNLGAKLETKLIGLEKYNLAFYSSNVSAELLAPIKQVCRKHKLTSFLSLLGPIASPVKLTGQIVGVGQENWFGTMVDLQTKLIERGLRQKAAVLISEFADGAKLDELSSASRSKIVLLNKEGSKEFQFDPKDFDLDDKKEDLQGGADHQANAQIILETLGHCEPLPSNPDPKIRTVALNVALLLYLQDQSQELSQYFQTVIEIISSGKALENFERFKGIV